MATVTVFSNTTDGNITSTGASWTIARDATTGTASDIADFNTNAIMEYYNGSAYFCYRSFFDFSLAAESGSADSVSLFIHGQGATGSTVSAQQGTQAIPMVAGDFDSFSGSQYGNKSSWSITAYNEIVFNAQGISDVDSQLGSGVMKVCCRGLVYDVNNTIPTGLNRAGMYFADNATDKPYLEIITSGGGGAVDALFFSHNF